MTDTPITTAPVTDAGAARAAIIAVRDEVAKVVVGQSGILSGVVAALLVNGHVLLEGVPGVAKTLLAKSVAAAFDMRFSRLQFTPDLMPADVIGQSIYELVPGQSAGFRFREGPVFTNLLLADEINRTPPKTQAALLEAMEERQVSLRRHDTAVARSVPRDSHPEPGRIRGHIPATGSPTRPLSVQVAGAVSECRPGAADVGATRPWAQSARLAAAGIRPVATAAHLASARQQIQAIRVDPAVLAYIVALCRATRESPSLQLGVSPRGATWLLHAAKAWAWLSGREFVTPDEVKAVAKPCLRHRIMVKPELELEGTIADAILDGLLATVPTPR